MSHPTILTPPTPIEGIHIDLVVQRIEDIVRRSGTFESLTQADKGYLLNVPAARMSSLSKAPSSLNVLDMRVDKEAGKQNREAHATENSARRDLNCVRPHLAVLMRLLIKHPEYADIMPPHPTNREVYDLIQPFMRAPGGPLNDPDLDVRKRFAPLFGRAAINSLKFLPTMTDQAPRDKSQPVMRLQMLIVLRLARIFRETYTAFRDEYLPEAERDNPLYIPSLHSWTILLERDSLTEWMADDILEQFDEILIKQWQDWFDNCYLKTLEREATSRGLTLEQALATGKWQNKTPVSGEEMHLIPTETKPILADESSPLVTFNTISGLTSPERNWVLGIAMKTFFGYRKRPNVRIDAPVSILLRHFLFYPEDLELFLTVPPCGDELLEQLQSIDPNFQRRHLGPLLGGAQASGYNMSKPGAEIPFYARRLSMLLVRHLKHGPDIYWNLREVVEDEARARGVALSDLWEKGRWY